MPRKKKEPRKLAVIDAETDPFLMGRTPKAFAWGFYDGETYKRFWGDDATQQLVDYILSRSDPLVIYAHNGGKFDFFFLMPFGVIQNPALIINGRIVKAQAFDIHEVRDSYAILPVPLKKIADSTIGSKKDIDYAKMEREVREEHKEEILDYLKQDCLVLYNIVFKFRERYADKLTVGAMAISELEKFHQVSRQNQSHDIRLRPYYYGGRVQCFEKGELIAPPGKRFKIFDVNSMYPAVMKNFQHPTGANYVLLGEHDVRGKFDKRTGVIKGFTGPYFMRFTGYSDGALPRRNSENGKLEFNSETGEFFACSHEIRAACELGLVRVDKIHEVLYPCNHLSFGEFVDFYIAEKIASQKAGNEAETLFAKFTLNSAYGKFGSNANEFKEWYIYDAQGTWEEHEAFEAWRASHPIIKGGKDGKVVSMGAELVHIEGRFEIWQAPAPSDRGFFDVAVAASITSAARSVLLRAIHGSTRPIYCDTDSLICEEIGGVIVDDHELGAWKCEGTTERIYIAGKKMYSCLLDQLGKDGKPKNKLASKGAKLTHDDMIKLCQGETVRWASDAPNFKFNGDVKFVARNIRASA